MNNSDQISQLKTEIINLEKELCNPPLLIDKPGLKVANPPEFVEHHQEKIAELKKKINDVNDANNVNNANNTE
ncbi:MAG: hypothetical protein Terrestrivirus4_134 [Terrestrivirus sp.]|uniref:Uncharacterized protein n=1 Tax=Terrestrivirus sp. TaxID=2487775 RepID=A0A3G4ZML6_9VIRU|nr:MAG: hypothetical protein Terrestrivirus4_134 [Terrestrivirus sp.]